MTEIKNTNSWPGLGTAPGAMILMFPLHTRFLQKYEDSHVAKKQF